MAGNFTYWHQLPNTTSIGETLVGAPMQYTGNQFVNLFLIGFFAILTIGAVQYNFQVKKAVVYSSFSTFILSFLFSLAGYAGGNQLITAAVVFMAVTAYNVMEGRIK
ncbi:MAG: hypothetical protein ABEK00_00200 [Candidatus Nanohaloarchaea archaeon]